MAAPHPAAPPQAGPARQPGGPAPAEPSRGTGRGGRVSPLGWTLRGLALCAISVVSGLLWVLIRSGSPEAPTGGDKTSPTRAGEFRFDLYTRDEPGSCQEHSTDRIAEYFAEHPCEHLTRALYTTTLSNGERVLTSISTALMPNTATADKLEKLTTQSGTGNVVDLVSAGSPVPESFPELDHDYGYASKQSGRLVVIGESSYFHNSDRDDARLKRVTVDALRLGWPQDRNQIPR